VVEEVDNPTWEDTWKELGVRGLWSIAPFTLMFCIVFDTLIVVASLAALWALANIICFRIPKDEFDFLK